MALLADLESGSCGMRLSVPPSFQLEREDADSAALASRERRGVALFLFRSPYRLDLRPEHEELLQRDIARGARELFETAYLTVNREGPPPAGGMRTLDPRWSPVIGTERVRLGGCDVLTVLHRMLYQPGKEQVMGHALVPIPTGLLEVRVLSGSHFTGLRESMLGERAFADSPRSDLRKVMERLGQSYFDDPKYDPEFPDHPLTVVRSELRRLLDPAVAQLTASPPSVATGEVPLPQLGCAVTPPPRYVPTAAGNALFSRVALATTSEVQLLSIRRLAREPSDPDPRAPLKVRQAHVLRQAQGFAQAAVRRAAKSSEIALRELPERRGRAEAAATVDFSFQPSAPRPERRNVILCFMDPQGGSVFVVAAAPCCVPSDELLEHVEAVAASWRPL